MLFFSCFFCSREEYQIPMCEFNLELFILSHFSKGYFFCGAESFESYKITALVCFTIFLDALASLVLMIETHSLTHWIADWKLTVPQIPPISSTILRLTLNGLIRLLWLIILIKLIRLIRLIRLLRLNRLNRLNRL